MTFLIQNTLYTIGKTKRAAVGQAKITFTSGIKPEKKKKK
jgi:hypothetical protein